MPLPLPNLDTQKFDDLVKEMQALIPRHAPEWTNHNLSDPGMTLVDLLAYLTETILYRVNQIPEETYRNFLSFLKGIEKGKKLEGPFDLLKTDILRSFKDPYRVITPSDFEQKAKEADPGNVGRVRVIPMEGKIVVAIVSAVGNSADLEKIRQELNKRKLVGTRINVREALYTDIRLKVKIIRRSNTREEEVRGKVEKTVTEFLDPLQGGDQKSGWPFGRPVSKFELLHFVQAIEGVNHVLNIIINENGETNELTIEDLPKLQQPLIEFSNL
jgi:hypothetical protein